MSEQPTISVAAVRTAHASRYLQQLSKHWSHKFDVEFTETTSKIALPFGRCSLRANAEELIVELRGPETQLAQFEEVVAEHLQRFGHRENLDFKWRRSPP